MIIACIISFIIGATIMLCAIGVVSNCKIEKPHNNVHFYVARDKNETLWLYMGKPIREDEAFQNNRHGYLITNSRSFENFGLNKDDYKDLKWEDEPVETFLDLED